jgi:hypothetical protein
MGYRDRVELLREWNEYARELDDSSPALRAQEQLAALEERRREALDRAQTFVERAGGSAPDPAALDRIATSARKLHALYQRGAELERKWSWIDDEKRVTEAAAAGLKERAIRILQSAGLAYDPERSWTEHGRELADRMKGRTRYNSLVEEFIPAVKKRLLPATEIEELERQLALLEVGGEEVSPPAQRSPAEVEDATRRLRERIDQIQKRRSDLRVQVEETWRRYHAEHPDKLAQRERVERALTKARRFKISVEMARETIASVATETHRRWADFLNQRVGEMLGWTGGRVEQLRFGDDLDFSLKLAGGQQLTRGKADLQLSAGARDQLYLAVRLAISEFLSRSDAHLPMLLDDVFVSSDDERTRQAMRALIEQLARDHQIILLTCQRARFEMLARLDRELYESRVQWLRLGSAAGVAGRG